MKRRERVHIPTDNSIVDLTKVIESLNKESDRGCVLVTASIVEGVITDILKKFLCSSTTNDDTLLDAYRPCADAGAKLNLLQRLALIDESLYKTLKDLYDLRNVFAHSDEPVSFDIEFVKNKVRSLLSRSEYPLRCFVKGIKIFPESNFDFKGDEEKLANLMVAKDTRGAFIFFFSFVYYWLRMIFIKIEPIQTYLYGENKNTIQKVF